MTICDKCGKQCEQAETINAFDSVFCLHDEKLANFKKLNGMPFKNDAKNAEVVTEGRDSSERKFIHDNRKKGNIVVRSSDGILRSVTKE